LAWCGAEVHHVQLVAPYCGLFAIMYVSQLRQYPYGISEEPVPQRSHLLSIFFSRIVATHSIPKIGRKAKVIAVEKPGNDPSLAANYRPISLLSVCYKLLERFALQRIAAFFPQSKGNLLSPDQANFRKD